MTLPIPPIAAMLVSAATVEDSAETEVINPILPVLPELIWSAVFFLGLWVLMKFVLLPPIIEGRQARKAKMVAGLDSVSDSEEELLHIKLSHDRRISEAKADAARIFESARSDADTQRNEALADLEAEIIKLKVNAQAEVDNATQVALAGAREPVTQLAVDAASKVLGRSVSATSARPMIERFLAAGESQ